MSSESLFTTRPSIGTRRRDENEPEFDFLDRSARPEAAAVREVLSDWLRRYPQHADDAPQERKQLQRSFQDKENNQHYAAFWQLLMHEVLVRLGYRVTVHPPLSWTNRRPDFLVRKDAEPDCLIEATIVTPDDQRDVQAHRRLRQVIKTIRSWQFNRFTLWVECSGSPPGDPPIQNDFRPRVLRWIKALDPDQLEAQMQSHPNRADLPSLSYEWQGWTIVVQPIPLRPGLSSQDVGGGVGSEGSTDAQICRAADNLRKAVKAKSKDFGVAPCPFYVAANTLESFFDRDDALDALYGDVSYSLLRDSQGIVTLDQGYRGKDGAFVREGWPINQHLSGVLIGDVYPWTIGNTESDRLRVYENHYRRPSADLTPSRAILRLPYCLIDEGKPLYEKGLNLRQLLRLPDHWPFAGADTRQGLRRRH